MARKRGGLAGIYDRNKGLIRTAATGLVGAFGSPLAAAALGAAMRGLDREGKRGIGLDIGQAARGGLEGYGMGRLGQATKGGVAKLFAPKGAPSFAPSLTTTEAPFVPSIGAPTMRAPDIMSLASAQPSASTGASFVPSIGAPSMRAPSAMALAAAPKPQPSFGSRIGGGVKSVAKFAQDYPKAVEAIAGALPSQANEVAARNAAVLEGRLSLEQQQFEEELRRQRMLEERQRQLAQLFMPILQRRMSEVNPTALG